MVSRAIARYIRISTRKTGNVLDLVRGKSVVKAETILDTINKRPAIYIKQLLRSASDSAEKRFKLSPAELYISMVKADKGPMLKRYRAATMGRATMIKHRTTHVILELDKMKRPETATKDITERESRKKPKAEKISKKRIGSATT
ncbi:MAG: 50S ribosomal protein L22 [Candidatus Omnitrophica bacterium]|nr:50S ribosomal protein L22 [Candidatus Omnitrophota bacterium]